MKKENKKKVKNNKGIISIFIIDAIIIFLLMLLINFNYDSTTSTLSIFGKSIYLAGNSAEETGKVIVSYIDTNGNSIRENDIYTGKLGDEYSVSRKEIIGYKDYGTDPINKKGNYDSTVIYVSFIYEEIPADYRLTSNENEYTAQILKDKSDPIKEYKFIIETYDEEGMALTESLFKVMRSNASIVRSGKDYTGRFVIGSIIVDEEGIDKFIISQVKAKNGYEALNEEIKVDIKKEYDEAKHEYIATAAINEIEDISVVVNEEEQEIIVKIGKRKISEETQNPEKEEKNTPEKTIIPGVKTGDKVLLFVGIIIVAVIINIVAIVMMKKSNNKEKDEE